MSLPNIDYMPPGYRIALVCKNCIYYKPGNNGNRGRFYGTCNLELLSNPTATPRPTHGTCTCDAHTIKSIGRNFHRLHDDYNAALPDQYAV
jgi:hypothetical protein